MKAFIKIVKYLLPVYKPLPLDAAVGQHSTLRVWHITGATANSTQQAFGTSQCATETL